MSNVQNRPRRRAQINQQSRFGNGIVSREILLSNFNKINRMIVTVESLICNDAHYTAVVEGFNRASLAFKQTVEETRRYLEYHEDVALERQLLDIEAKLNSIREKAKAFKTLQKSRMSHSPNGNLSTTSEDSQNHIEILKKKREIARLEFEKEDLCRKIELQQAEVKLQEEAEREKQFARSVPHQSEQQQQHHLPRTAPPRPDFREYEDNADLFNIYLPGYKPDQGPDVNAQTAENPQEQYYTPPNMEGTYRPPPRHHSLEYGRNPPSYDELNFRRRDRRRNGEPLPFHVNLFENEEQLLGEVYNDFGQHTPVPLQNGNHRRNPFSPVQQQIGNPGNSFPTVPQQDGQLGRNPFDSPVPQQNGNPGTNPFSPFTPFSTSNGQLGRNPFDSPVPQQNGNSGTNPFSPFTPFSTSNGQLDRNLFDSTVSVQNGDHGSNQSTVARQNGWQNNHTGNNNNSLNYTQTSDLASQKTARLLYLSTCQPAKFDGKAREYPAFESRLSSLLGDGLLTDYECVDMMPKFVEGEPLKVVKNMQGRSYKAIMQRLHERYGHPTLVANDYIQELVSGSPLQTSDRKGLLSYADQIVTAADTLTGQYLVNASCQPNLEKMVNKLPSYLQNQWEKKVGKICTEKGAPELKDLAKFVESAASIKNNPFYHAREQKTRQDVRTKIDQQQQRPNRGTLSSHGTDVVSTPERDSKIGKKNKFTSTCLICYKEHKTWFCTDLKSLPKGPEREKLIREKRLCIVCFNRDCRHATCPRREDKFVCKNCPLRHHKTLQCKNPDIDSRDKDLNVKSTDVNNKETSDDGISDSESCEDDSVISSHARVDIAPKEEFMLGLMPINVNGPNGKVVSTYAFIDSGSKASFIDEQLAEQLGITGPKQSRFIKTIVGRRRQNLKKVSFNVSNIKTGEKFLVDWETYILMNVDLSTMISDDHALTNTVAQSQHEHLKKLKIPEPEMKKVGLLLGLPFRQAHEVIRYHDGGKDKPYGIETKLGISVAGPVPEIAPTTGIRVMNINVEKCPKFDKSVQDPPLEQEPGLLLQLLEKLWNFEDYGNDMDPDKRLSPQNRRALEIFRRTLVHKFDLHYECGLMWAKDEFIIPYNRHIALAKLHQLLQRFKRDPVFAAMFKKAMSDLFINDWAEEVPKEEVHLQNGKVLYLIYFGLSNPNKPGRIILIFNAAAEYEGVSLNSLLIGGPDTSCTLIGVILRSRFGKYCAASDVKAMFNQCGVRKEDRDALRFLWIDENGEVKDYRMKVHIFGAADSPFCANSILKQIGKDNCAKYEPEIIAAIENNFYVDDSLVNAGTPEKLISIATGLKSALAEGGMNLTKFTSNSKVVLRAIDSSDWAKPELDLDMDDLPIQRTLGLQWNVENDTFGYCINEIQVKDTLRGLTGQVARTFDPIGGVAPALLKVKRLIQECWRRKLNWDEDLPDDLLKSWKGWKQDFHLLDSIKIPRPYFPNYPDCREGLTLQLHLMSDSCDYATGLVAYLRGEEPNGTVHIGFVMGKCKLLPLQPVLYEPKGEMKAAVDLVRLGVKLESELRLTLEPTVYWTDSELVLKYIYNETKSFKPFIANRRSEIREKSKISQWRHCPGLLNCADPASRGVSIQDYSSEHPYLKGPSFLLNPEPDWPKTILSKLSDQDSQIKTSKPIACHRIALDTENTISKLIHDKSSVVSMKKLVSWCVRFRENCKLSAAAGISKARIAEKAEAEQQRPRTRSASKHPAAKKPSLPIIYPPPLSVKDLVIAEIAIILHIQREYWPEEFSCLYKAEPIKSSSRILNLNPFIGNDGLMRVGGRLNRAVSIDYDIKHPIILPKPKECRFTATLIINSHYTLMHAGSELVLGKLRERYWIIHAKSFIRTVVAKCVICRKRNAQPITQQMSALPSDRVEVYEPCFTNTGTDCFGPIVCKDGRRRDVKYYGVLFVCLNTMAVHIESVKTLGTDDFIKSLLRFVALRNNVKTIRSDNGSNYIGAEREIRELMSSWNQDHIVVSMRSKGIEWTFQPPLASSMSGIWERKVKESKRHLYATLKNESPDPDTLRTLLYEVSSIMNSSPLRPISDDPTCYDALTPAHFLFQRPASTILDVPTDQNDHLHSKKWRQTQFLADCYWHRYIKEYIPCLNQRRKWLKMERNLRINDLVLLVNPDVPRKRWTYGRVIETFPSQNDGLVRSVRVRTKDSQYIRPIQKLALISASDG